jgi:penicillin-binding protein 1A
MLRLAASGLLLCLLLAAGLAAGLAAWLLPQLPPTERLREVRFQTPLKVYTRDGKLVAEFGEKRREPVALDEVPLQVRQAFLAAEDDRFYQHPGVDWMALVRAAMALALSGERAQGGSTITMQVARNFFLSREKTYQRKLTEIALAFRIESELSKNEIFELYLNKIFLGHRAYGVAAAAQVYFGKPLSALSLAEAAMIAGLPKAPSRLNPVTAPEAAQARRHYVLVRMLDLGLISDAEFASAEGEPLPERVHGQPVEVSAPHVAEMVREQLIKRYGQSAYTKGLRAYTTLDSHAQAAANEAVRAALDTYDRRHGYRGPEAHSDLAGLAPDRWHTLLYPYRSSGLLRAALVTEVQEDSITVLDVEGTQRKIPWAGLRWARKFIAPDNIGKAPTRAADLVRTGDIVRISPQANLEGQGEPEVEAWRLAQLPLAEGALVALAPVNGAILALVGGYDFERSKFNRVTQALRQPGSNFKPFIYSAALAHGYTPATLVNDAPIVFEAPGLEGAWRPENYSGTYYGPTPLREALAHSRNLVSIRMMRDIGIEQTLAHVARFGFDPARLPHNLSLSLGTGELTPLQLARGYAVFANGGFLIDPHVLQRVEDPAGKVLFSATPVTACLDCETREGDGDAEPEDLAALIEAETAAAVPQAPRVLDAQNAWLMYSMMKDVITRGTARRALSLARADLAGKTGTTNDLKDARFSGFNARVVTTAWVGYDDSVTLGPLETGARTALPMWIDFTRRVLADTPLAELPLPAGLVTVRTGSTGTATYETYRAEDVPRDELGQRAPLEQPPAPPRAVEQLF